MKHPNKEIMMQVLELAKKKHSVTAFIVKGDKIISKSVCSYYEDKKNGYPFIPTGHAEVNAIESACEKLKSEQLTGCWLYSSLECCPMCASAAIWAGVDGIVYSALEEDRPDKERLDDLDNWIYIRPKDIIKHAKIKPKIVSGFLRKEGKKINYWA